MSYRGRNRAIQLVGVKVSVDFTKHTRLSSAYEQRDSANETILIVTHKIWSAVNCPIKEGIVPISWLIERNLSIHKTHTTVISTQTRTERQRKRDNCNRHSQVLERSQLFDSGLDSAIQLVVVESSVDFTKYTMLLSAHEHKQKDSANEAIVIVTDKVVSAVNCPIKVEIVPVSWLRSKYLLISQRTHCCHQHTNTNKDTAQTRQLLSSHNSLSAVNCPIKDGIVPFSWLASRRLLISQSTHCCHQRTNMNIADSAKRKNCNSSLTK